MPSDVIMLCIPLPILIRAKLPLQKKLILCIIFSLGVFVIVAALLSKYYSFSLPYGVDWVYWYVREVSTAVIVANIPHCWVLVRRMFNLRAFLSKGTAARSNGGTNERSHDGSRRAASHQADEGRQWFKMGSKVGSKSGKSESSVTRTDSEERITGLPLKIYQDVEFHVQNEREEDISHKDVNKNADREWRGVTMTTTTIC